MEIEFKEGSRSRRLLLVVGVVLAFGTAVAVFALTSGAQPAQAEVPMRTVIVATSEIAPRTVLEPGMLTTRTVPEDPALDHAYTDTETLLGRATGTTIYAQQVITPNLLATAAVGSTFAVLAPDEVIGPDTPDWRAVSVDVPDERAIAGMLVAGQRVDVVVTADVTVVTPVAVEGEEGTLPDLVAFIPIAPGEPPPPGSNGDCRVTPYGETSDDPTIVRYCAVSNNFISEKSSKVVFQDVEILAREASRYVLRVDARMGERISHLQATGTSSFSMLLRGDGDSRELDTTGYGQTTNAFIEDFGLPVPEIYPRP